MDLRVPADIHGYPLEYQKLKKIKLNKEILGVSQVRADVQG